MKGKERSKSLTMVSREHKKAAAAATALHEKLQQLRSITNSHAHSKTSIIIDASKYIEDLKQKVEKLNQDIEASAKTCHDQNPLPMVAVETLEKGYLINVYLDRSCPGLLMSILEAFEELSLNVLEARLSCTDIFQLEALGGKNEEVGESVDAEVVKQAVVQAIKSWSESIN